MARCRTKNSHETLEKSFFTILIKLVACFNDHLFAQYIPILGQLLSEKRQKLHKLVEFSCEHIYRNDHENDAYNRICSDHMDYTMKKIVEKTFMMFSGGLGSVVIPLYSALVLGVKTTSIQVKYPFIVEKSSIEFYMNIALQLMVFTRMAYSFTLESKL